MVADHTITSQIEGPKRWKIAGNPFLYPIT